MDVEDVYVVESAERVTDRQESKLREIKEYRELVLSKSKSLLP